MALAAPLVALLGILVFGTSFLAGVFGMAGGMILMGVLVYIMPVPSAMVLHAFTQLASNGWRAILWYRYTNFVIVLRFLLGVLAALAMFMMILYVPDTATVLIVLGLVPLAAVAVPDNMAPRADQRGVSEICGFVSTCLQLVSGVSGPLLDAIFVRMQVDRRTIVATKATAQVTSHTAKLVYFGGIAAMGEAAISVTVIAVGVIAATLGTIAARRFLEKLSDIQFRRWQKRIVLAIGVIYLSQGIAMHLGWITI